MAPLVLAVGLPCLAFVIQAPGLRDAGSLAARAASVNRPLEARWQSPSVLTAFPQQQRARIQPRIDEQSAPSKWLLHVQRLLLRLLDWSIAYCNSAEDVLLALVAPDTYRLLSRWRRDVFGGELQIRQALAAAQSDILGSVEPELVNSVSARSKSLWSTFHKACMRGQLVHDVLAVRLIVHGEEEDCHRGFNSIHHLWPSVPGRRKDYVSRPKANGYQALHDTVLLPCGTPVEVQVRTTEMHRHAELGQASHRKYKGQAHELPAKVLSDISSLAFAPPLPDFWSARPLDFRCPLDFWSPRPQALTAA